MALVDSLLTAMVRANGDALVMHVGERPYVVRKSGTIDLSTNGLNLDAMTGMLSQLLPADAQNSLQEFGAVEHQLPSKDDDRFTVVAARGDDDIWIEIRRSRKAPALVAEIAVPQPPQFAPVVEQVEIPVASEPAEAASQVNELQAMAEPEVMVEPEVMAEPVPMTEPVAVVESVAMVEPETNTELPVIAEPHVINEPLAVDEPVTVAEPSPIVEAAIPETIVTPPMLQEVMAQEPVVVDAPSPVEVPVAVAMAAVEPDVVEPAVIEPAVVEPPPAVESLPVQSPPPAVEPLAIVSPAPPTPLHGLESVVLPMNRSVRIDVPQPMPSSRIAGVERLLRMAAARGASALYLTAESRPYLRVEGDIRILEDESVLTRADVEAAAIEIGPEDAKELVRRSEATEWIAELPELGRIRCTSFQDHHGPGVLFRMIATRAATAEQLGLSREVQALATEAEGLVLVAGPRASGKTTLMSALVDLVNRQRADHVITLERQIRLVHDNRTALISQREIRGGADEALAAARAALRENPDVLVVDDLSSAQMVPLLLEAAGQGLLVMVSITAPSTTDAVVRFVDLVPPEMRAAVQAAMSETFRGAVAQVLLKKTGGGRVTAREVLLGTASVTRLIADGQLAQLPLALENGRKHGMMPMTDALLSFVQTGAVDAREAFRKAQDRDRLIAGLKRAGIDTSAVERLA